MASRVWPQSGSSGPSRGRTAAQTDNVSFITYPPPTTMKCFPALSKNEYLRWQVDIYMLPFLEEEKKCGQWFCRRAFGGSLLGPFKLMVSAPAARSPARARVTSRGRTEGRSSAEGFLVRKVGIPSGDAPLLAPNDQLRGLRVKACRKHFSEQWETQHIFQNKPQNIPQKKCDDDKITPQQK